MNVEVNVTLVTLINLVTVGMRVFLNKEKRCGINLTPPWGTVRTVRFTGLACEAGGRGKTYILTLLTV